MSNINNPPLEPQNIIDLIFSSTFYTSSNTQGQELGQYFLIDFIKSIKEQHKEDSVAISYIHTIEPIIGSALRAFSVEKLNYKRKILPLERLSLGEEAAINEHVGSIPLLSVAQSSSKWTKLLSNTMFGLVGGAVAVSMNIDASMIKLVSMAAIGTSLAVILFSGITRSIKALLISRLIDRTRIKLDQYWEESYSRYESILIDALISSIRAKEEYYPTLKTFRDGHLFPRETLPYLQPMNATSLSASPRCIDELVDELLSIVQARMSIRPGTDRASWLKSRIRDKADSDN